MYLIFFSNRRRHTICALVTGVQRVLFRSDGLFDLIFNFGLLYHLRHPLLALDKTRAVCRGAMILETHVVNAFGNLPASLFYRRDELVTSTNWTGPNDSAVVNWLMDEIGKHTSEIQSLMRNSYAVFCLQKKKDNT